MTDADDFTDYGEPCGCGHTRSKHGNLPGCSGTHERLDMTELPAPEYAPEDSDNPFAWPANWPPVDQAPRVAEPCKCRAFGPADPEPPEGWF